MSVTIDSLDIQIRSSAGSAKQKIEELAKALDGLSGQENVKRIISALNKLPQPAEKSAEALKKLDKANKNAANSADKHSKALNKQNVNLLATYEHLQNVFSMLHGIQDAFAKMMNGAIQWDGIQFQFGRAFGEDAEEVLEYAEKVSKALKINQQQFMESASLYGSLLKGFGVEQGLVTTMGVGLTELSYDIWAAYNNRYKTLDAASEAVRSAITGEIEPIRNAGIALTEASMQEYLDSIGMAHVSMEKLTEAQKSEVRYATMVNAAMNQGIIGTYAREMETAEGAVRTLTQQLTTLSQAFGSLFIPILKEALPWLTAFVQLVTEGIIALGAMFGIKFQEITWGDAKGMAQTAEGANATQKALGGAAKEAKKLKDYTMGFDELNIIDPSSASGGAGAAGAGGIGSGDSLGLDLDTLWDDAVLASASKQVDELKEKIRAYIDEHKAMLAVVGTVAGFLGFMKVLRGLNSLLGITKTIDNLKTAFNGIKTAATGLKTAGSNVKAFFQLLKSGSGLGNTLAAAFPKAATILSSAGTWVTGTLGPALKTALTKLPTILVNAVKAIPVWGWVIAAIAAVIGLAVVDYDFTEIGHKIGEALGKALKFAMDAIVAAGTWIENIGFAIENAFQGAIDWVVENFDFLKEIDLKDLFKLSTWTEIILPELKRIGGDVLDGLVQGIKDGWNNFWGNIEEFISGFIDGFKEGLGIHSPSTVFAEIGGYIIEGLLNGISEKWEALKAWFSTNIAPKFTKEFWANKWENVRQGAVEKLTEIKKGITDKVGEITTWFTTKVSPKLTIEYWKEKFDGMRQGIAEKLAEVKQAVTDRWNEITGWFSSNISPKLTLDYWKNAFSGIGDGLKEAVKSGVNKAIDLLNQFIDWANDALNIEFDGLKNPKTGEWIIKPMSIQLATIPKIPSLASGGFVDAGQMFIAREAGPELVGNINGRTAVANNDQIVAAVSQGVYEAVVAAMGMSRGSGNQNINVYLDGRQITAAVEKRQSERGMQLIGNQLGYAY